jgi:hypothetical protein
VNAPLDPALLSSLRAQRGGAIRTLAQARGVSEREAAALLAQAFAMPCFETAQLQQRSPAFHRLPLARAQ